MALHRLRKRSTRGGMARENLMVGGGEEDVPLDYQLQRALDLIRGIALFEDRV